MTDTPAEQPKPTPMVDGKYYETSTPTGDKMIVMTEKTWLDFGTNFETARQMIKNLTRKLGEAQAGERSALVRLADVQTRLDNLRAVRRAEKRPEVEAGLSAIGITPNDTLQG